MRGGVLGLLVALGTVGGCASAARPEVTAPAVRPTAQRKALTELERTEAMQRLYGMGERYFDVGNYVQAVALWRQVFLLLPSGPEGDRLRHEVVARMAHGFMHAFEADGEPGHLDQAEAMLERYVAKHEALFPNGARPEAERAEIYDLIGAIAALRSRAEPAEGEVELTDASEPGDEAVTREFERLHARVATHAGETVGADGIARDVVVPKRRRLASLEDPKVRRYLEHPSPLGGSLLAGGHEALNPTRPLVRAGLSRVRGEAVDHADEQRARRQLRQALRAARPELEQCYAEALSRSPEMVERLAVSVTIDGRGRVAAVDVVEGSLTDAVGDACVAWAFMGAAPLPELAIADAVTLELPMTFFVEGEKHITPSFLGNGAGMGDAIREFEAGLYSAFDAGVGP